MEPSTYLIPRVAFSFRVLSGKTNRVGPGGQFGNPGDISFRCRGSLMGTGTAMDVGRSIASTVEFASLSHLLLGHRPPRRGRGYVCGYIISPFRNEGGRRVMTQRQLQVVPLVLLLDDDRAKRQPIGKGGRKDQSFNSSFAEVAFPSFGGCSFFVYSKVAQYRRY